MEAGCRVVRGPDWKWGDQDGGEGHVGTVVVVGRTGSVSSPDKTVVVQWDGGTRTNYRCGYQGAFDLRLFDNGPIGTVHSSATCNECKKKGIEGIRWECVDCLSFNLCSLCYMSDKHFLEHAFNRVEAHGKPGVYVGKRLDKCKIQSKGIFPGAQVVRGPDWDWGNQDGGQGNIGQVVDVRGWDRESFRSVACVLWKPKLTNVYRVGHKGKVDLTCLTVGFGGCYYKNHLPKLGQDPESLVIPSSSNPTSNHVMDTGSFQIGDRVRVLLDMNALRDLQEGHGGWNAKMEEVIGIVGTIHRITERGDIRVQYPGFVNRWTFHPAALTKVDEVHIHDTVRVLKDEGLVMKLQVGHGEWTSEMTVALDKVGKVLKIYSDGDIRVAIAGQTWTFNPAVLIKEGSPAATPTSQPQGEATTPQFNITSARPQQQQGSVQQQSQTEQQSSQQQQRQQPVASEEQRKRSQQSQREIDQSLRSLLEHLRINSSSDIGSMIVSEAGQGNLERLKELLKAHPDKVNIVRSDKTALQIASHQGLTDVVKFLLQSGASVSLQDAEGDTALHYAAFGNQPDVAAVLLERGADCDRLNKNKCAPLHVAVNKGHTEVVRTLLRFSCDVNAQDSYGDMALHDAIAKDFEGIVELLVNARGADLSVKNKRGFNCLHHAALKGNARAASLIAQKAPNLLNVVKEDGFSPLHLAALNGHHNVVKCLVEARPQFDVNIRNTRRQTPLLLAVDKRQTAIAQLLLDHGADVNAQDDVGDSPLHVVVTFHSLKFGGSSTPRKELSTSEPTFVITKLLMDHGADTSLVNQHGKSPVQLCRDPRLREVMSRYANTVETSTPNKSQASTSASPQQSSQASASSVVAVETDVECQICGLTADAKFEPCGHVMTCMSCASMLNKCFRCKTAVQSFSRVQEQRSGDESQCMVCSDVEASVKFEPCGHTIACQDCAGRMKKCLKCKDVITRKISNAETPIQPEPSEKDEKYLETLHNLLSLQARVREIEDANMCAICLEKPRNIAFMCGHGTCVECAKSLELCPMCRKPIEQVIKLFS